MNTFDDMVRTRIDELIGLAGRIRQERDLRTKADTTEGVVLAATVAGAIETAGPSEVVAADRIDPGQTDRPECPSSMHAA